MLDYEEPDYNESTNLYSMPVPDEPHGLGLSAAQNSGIGIAEQAPAPVVAAIPTMNAAPRPSVFDQRRDVFQKMSGGEKFATALGEFGAALQGKDSPMDRRLAMQKQERLQQLQEFQVHTAALNDGIKMMENLSGDARTTAMDNYAARLDGVSPGLGATFKTLGKEPEIGKWIMEHAADIPELATAMQIDPSGKTARKIVSSPDFMKRVEAVRDNKQLPLILQKGQSFKANWQQVAPPEMVARFNKDGELSAPEILEANAWIKANKPELAALTFNDNELQVIGRHGDTIWNSLGVLTAKDENAIRVDAAKEKNKPKDDWTDPYMQDGALVKRNRKDNSVVQVVARPPVTNNIFQREDKKFEKEDKLRADYTANPFVKSASEMDSAFRMIEAAYKNPNAANDLAMATKFMKILDPTSVVRESEFALAVNATGLLDKTYNLAQSIFEGKKLNPAQRQQFYESAKAINDSFQKEREKVDQQYSETATGYGLDPKNVVTSLRNRRATDKPADTEPKKIKNDAEYNALPSGAEFIDPKGVKRKKP